MNPVRDNMDCISTSINQILRQALIGLPLCITVMLAVHIIISHPASAQVYDQDRFVQVRARLDAQYALLAEKGYKREALEVILPMGPQHAMSFQLDLVAGRTYAIVAACDDLCTRVGLLVLNDRNESVIERSDDGNVTIMSGSVATGGIHFGALEAPGCPDDRCQAGLSVLRLETGAGQP